MADWRGRVLIIAGSDSGGGAGIQGDIKTITMLGGYAATAITAITVQNTCGVTQSHPLAVDLVLAQAGAVLDDIGADAIKTGMLGDADIVEAVAELLSRWPLIPAVIDPVMIAKGGHRLMTQRAVEAVISQLVPRATLLTPNAPEAEALTGLSITCTDDLRRAGERLLTLGARSVLMKGGHVAGDPVTDVLMTAAGETTFEAPRLETRNTHGTGCTLASACAVGLAQGLDLPASVARAWAYTGQAIAGAQGFGSGHGPVDHGWPLRRQ